MGMAPDASAGKSAGNSSDQPRFLVIEDDLAFQKLIRARLTERWPKAQVVTLDPTRGRALNADLDGSAFDLVVLDYRIGDRNGLELLRVFRQRKGFPPVVMITGQGDESLAVDAIRAGAADYLSKQGLTQDALVATLEKALASHPREVADATPRPVPAPAMLPEVEGYEVLAAVGQGRAGTVYRARRRADGLELALKIVRAELSGTANEELIDRCLRESELMQRLRSPRVARIHEQRFTDYGLVTAMEWIDGGSVRDLRLAGRVPLQRALRVVRETAEALADIHAAGIIHRDLKPGNILLRQDGSVVLVDFGVARELDGASSLTRRGEMLGTPAYVSPEQAQGLPVDARTDLYSLGVILFELLTDEAPYRALTANAVVQKHLHAPLPELPVDLWVYQGLVDRLMAKHPVDRYPSAAALLVDLDGLA